MANEGYYQKKIIKWFIASGGTAITGMLPTGEADIQAGFPCKGRLLNVMVEVKTPDNYDRVMRGVEEVDGLYEIVNEKALKEHEPLQIYKVNNVRKRGGLALIACCISQVSEYINKELANE